MEGAGWTRLVRTETVFTGDGLLYAVGGRGTVAGVVATLYNAIYANTNRQLFTLVAPANEYPVVSFSPPLRLQGGLHVVFDANGVELLVSWREVA